MENKNKWMEKERTKSMSGRKRPLVSADIIKAKKVDVMQLFFPSVHIHGGCQYQQASLSKQGSCTTSQEGVQLNAVYA